MPKDSPAPKLGHRHDWEQCIVWLSSNLANATIEGFSVSAHGGLETTRTPGMSGHHPLAEYLSYYPLNHQLIQTKEKGGAQPVIAWEMLTVAARDALQTTNFGDAIVPFKDETFIGNLEEGYAAF